MPHEFNAKISTWPSCEFVIWTFLFLHNVCYSDYCESFKFPNWTFVDSEDLVQGQFGTTSSLILEPPKCQRLYSNACRYEKKRENKQRKLEFERERERLKAKLWTENCLSKGTFSSYIYNIYNHYEMLDNLL